MGRLGKPLPLALSLCCCTFLRTQGSRAQSLGEMKVLGVSEEGQPEELLFLHCLQGVH